MSATETERRFILLHKKDNTVTALLDLDQGDALTIDAESGTGPILLRQKIPYAHKFARAFIPKGTDVIKYGEVIGVASTDIQPGDHVHVHNVESKRARGDVS
jgi:altronate dehydratase small subunit